MSFEEGVLHCVCTLQSSLFQAKCPEKLKKFCKYNICIINLSGVAQLFPFFRKHPIVVTLDVELTTIQETSQNKVSSSKKKKKKRKKKTTEPNCCYVSLCGFIPTLGSL